jgi:radical SAM protein with 4Fe4S-binding SPASM domain
MTLVTNLNAIDEKKLDFLVKENIGLCTSLDGPKFIHDFNRPLLGNLGSYDNVVKWVKIIRERYKKEGLKSDIGALITVTKKAIDYPKAVVDEYLKNKFATIHLRPLSVLGCASASWQKIGYTPEQFIDFWKKAMDYIIRINKEGVSIDERMAIIMLRKILGASGEDDYLDLRSPCGAAIGQLLYNYDGSIFTCDEGRMVGNDIFKIGTVNQTYKDVITSKQTCAIVASSINDCDICDDCVYKPYCGICPVCNYFEQGSIIANIPSTPRCKIYMAMFDYIVEKYLFDRSAKPIFDKWVFGKK